VVLTRVRQHPDAKPTLFGLIDPSRCVDDDLGDHATALLSKRLPCARIEGLGGACIVGAGANDRGLDDALPHRLPRRAARKRREPVRERGRGQTARRKILERNEERAVIEGRCDVADGGRGTDANARVVDRDAVEGLETDDGGAGGGLERGSELERGRGRGGLEGLAAAPHEDGAPGGSRERDRAADVLGGLGNEQQCPAAGRSPPCW
jgi:hypothetical protein